MLLNYLFFYIFVNFLKLKFGIYEYFCVKMILCFVLKKSLKVLYFEIFFLWCIVEGKLKKFMSD